MYLTTKISLGCRYKEKKYVPVEAIGGVTFLPS